MLTPANHVSTGSPLLARTSTRPTSLAPHHNIALTYQDLGKSAGDLLQKDYPIQGTSLEVKTLTPSNVTFKVAGQRSQDAQIAGDIEGKYVDFKNGLTVTQVSLACCCSVLPARQPLLSLFALEADGPEMAEPPSV